MTSNKVMKLTEAINHVEHPAIAATLTELGMLKDIEISEAGEVSLSLLLPFPQIPENVQNYMINSLAEAAQSAGGELNQVNLSVMNPTEKQNFLRIETQNWRG